MTARHGMQRVQPAATIAVRVEPSGMPFEFSIREPEMVSIYPPCWGVVLFLPAGKTSPARATSAALISDHS